MPQTLTFTEIQQQYQHEWLLIAYPAIDPKSLQILQGEVLAHSPDIEVIYQPQQIDPIDPTIPQLLH
jgi:hypothetical protein